MLNIEANRLQWTLKLLFQLVEIEEFQFCLCVSKYRGVANIWPGLGVEFSFLFEEFSQPIIFLVDLIFFNKRSKGNMVNKLV